jgi:hypothetical protein
MCENAFCSEKGECAVRGWECPVCGVGVAPDQKECLHKSRIPAVCDPQYYPIFQYPYDLYPQKYIVTCGNQVDKVYGKSSYGL